MAKLIKVVHPFTQQLDFWEILLEQNLTHGTKMSAKIFNSTVQNNKELDAFNSSTGSYLNVHQKQIGRYFLK